jgi:hypothetical protein
MRAFVMAIIAFHALASTRPARADAPAAPDAPTAPEPPRAPPDAAPRDPAAEAAAQRHLDRGIAAFERGEFRVALRELGAARDLVPHKPNPYRWLALSAVQLGDCVHAVVNIDAFVARAPAGDARLSELGRLRELCQRTGILKVTAEPEATLRIDGAIVGKTPFRALSMRAGAHEVAAERAGFASASRSIVVTAGKELTVHLALSPPSKPMTRRWWFWTIAAGSAIAAGALVYFVAGGDDDPARLPPIQCGPDGCRP